MMKRERSLSECERMIQKDVKESRGSEIEHNVNTCLMKTDDDKLSVVQDATSTKPFELYKRRTTVTVTRSHFLDVVCEALSEYKYVGPNQRADLVLGCRYSYHLAWKLNYVPFWMKSHY